MIKSFFLRNQVTRIYYVIAVNGVLLDPLTQTVYPTGPILQKYIETIPINYNDNYQLCAAKLKDSVFVSYLTSQAIANKPVPLVINQYILESTFSGYNDFLTALQNSLVLSNPVFGQYSLNIQITPNIMSRIGLVNANIGATTQFSQDQLSFPLTWASFQIVLNGSTLSYATQSLFDLNTFYQKLKEFNSLFPSLSNLVLVSPNVYPVLDPKNLFHLTLTKRIASSNRTYLQNTILSFITQNSIGNF